MILAFVFIGHYRGYFVSQTHLVCYLLVDFGILVWCKVKCILSYLNKRIRECQSIHTFLVFIINIYIFSFLRSFQLFINLKAPNLRKPPQAYRYSILNITRTSNRSIKLTCVEFPKLIKFNKMLVKTYKQNQFYFKNSSIVKLQLKKILFTCIHWLLRWNDTPNFYIIDR